MKFGLIVLTFIAAIGGLVFHDQVAGLFAGMTPLEALETIVTFVLHVAVTTIAAYVAYTLPEIAKPWVKTFRWKRRAERRGRHGDGGWQSGPNAHWGRAGGGGKINLREMLTFMPFLQGETAQGQQPRLDLSQYRLLNDDESGDLDIEA